MAIQSTVILRGFTRSDFGRVSVRMTVESFDVRDFDAPKNEPSPHDKRVNVIADSNVNHASRL